MSDELSIKDCRYKCEEIGKHVKSSKLKHIWEFNIDGINHIVELYESVLSNKKKIIVDEKVILEQKY
jgi:hypothetical protein